MGLLQSISDLSVQTKLFGGFGLGCVLIILVAYSGISGLNAAESSLVDITEINVQLLESSSEIYVHLLQARRNEKDFLQRLETSYLTEMNTNLETVQSDAGYIQQLDISKDDMKKARDIESNAKEYQQSFNTVADLTISRGLTEDKGLQGELRNAVRDIEAELEALNTDGSQNQLMVDMLTMRRNEKDYLLRGDVKYQTQLHDAARQFQTHLEESNIPSSKKDNIKSLLNIYVTSFDDIVEIDAEISTETTAYMNSVHAIEPLVEDLQQKAVDDINVENTAAISEISRAYFVMISMALIAFPAALLIGLFASRSVTKPVEEILDAANRIAEGDLTVDLANRSKDEMGQLTAAIRRMVENLGKLVGEVQQSSMRVSSSAEELSAASEEMSTAMEEMSSSAEQMRNGAGQVATTAQQIATGAQQQSEKVNVVSRSLNDMTEGIQQVASNAQRAASGTESANKVAAEVGGVAKQLAVKMKEIEGSVGDSARVIKDLESKSSQIGEIVEIITGIADQTNLLALNAAIEAARAGEHGRGFAVVADEVRSLAEESGKAAKQIEGLIKEVQKGTENAVSSMDVGTSEVAAGAETLKNTLESIEKVIEAIRDASTMVQEISAASEEQAASIEEITASMEDVSAISEETASGSQEASAASEEQTSAVEQQVSAIGDVTTTVNQVAKSSVDLAAMAEKLQEAVMRFKLDASPGYTAGRRGMGFNP